MNIKISEQQNYLKYQIQKKNLILVLNAAVALNNVNKSDCGQLSESCIFVEEELLNGL